MTFDDELQRALATLADRLRDDVSREIAAAEAVLRASAPSERPRTEPYLTLLEQIRALDRAGTLAETLDALTVAASSHAPRVAVLLAQRSRYHAWRLSGFKAIDDPGAIEITGDEAGLLADAADTGDPVELRAGSRRSPGFAGEPAYAIACPVSLAGETVAVVYADAGEAAQSSEEAAVFNRAALEILCRYAARKLEALTAFMAARHAVGVVRDPERVALQGPERVTLQGLESPGRQDPILRAG